MNNMDINYNGSYVAILDAGSYQLRGGFSDDESPRIILESIIGNLKGRNMLPNNMPTK
jgi:actin-related protein